MINSEDSEHEVVKDDSEELKTMRKTFQDLNETNNENLKKLSVLEERQQKLKVILHEKDEHIKELESKITELDEAKISSTQLEPFYTDQTKQLENQLESQSQEIRRIKIENQQRYVGFWNELCNQNKIIVQHRQQFGLMEKQINQMVVVIETYKKDLRMLRNAYAEQIHVIFGYEKTLNEARDENAKLSKNMLENVSSTFEKLSITPQGVVEKVKSFFLK